MLRLSEREKEGERTTCDTKREERKVLPIGGRTQVGFWEMARCAMARKDKRADLSEKKNISKPKSK